MVANYIKGVKKIDIGKEDVFGDKPKTASLDIDKELFKKTLLEHLAVIQFSISSVLDAIKIYPSLKTRIISPKFIEDNKEIFFTLDHEFYSIIKELEKINDVQKFDTLIFKNISLDINLDSNEVLNIYLTKFKELTNVTDEDLFKIILEDKKLNLSINEICSFLKEIDSMRQALTLTHDKAIQTDKEPPKPDLKVDFLSDKSESEGIANTVYKSLGF